MRESTFTSLFVSKNLRDHKRKYDCQNRLTDKGSSLHLVTTSESGPNACAKTPDGRLCWAGYKLVLSRSQDSGADRSESPGRLRGVFPIPSCTELLQKTKAT